MAEKIELEVALKAANEKMQSFQDTGKVNAKNKNAFSDTMAEIRQVLGSANPDWNKLKQLIHKLGNILVDTSISIGDVSKETQEYLKKMKSLEKSIEKFDDKIEKQITGKGYHIDKDTDKVTGLRKSAASGQDSWQLLFEQQQKSSNAILSKSGKPMAWSTFQNQLGTEAVQSQVGFKEFQTKLAEDIGRKNQEYQNLKSEQVKIEAQQVELESQKPIESSSQANEAIGIKTNLNIAADQTYNANQSGGNGDFGGIKDLELTTKGLEKQSTSLGKAFKQFSIYALAVRTARQALNSAAKTIKDLDKYLTEQAMVTGRTRKETYALLKLYQQMAGELGATTKEVAEVATQFMRQGKTAQDAMTLTRAAISAAKVAGISATESVNYLTTALNGFRLSAEDAMRVSDKFASIAAQSATSYEEIAIALSKVAAQANMAGMSIDYTAALLAKGIETTREAAETIGTALKTIIARMRELTDYGATLEDGMSINNVETQLRYVGIALRNQNGELYSTEEVLDELGGKWEELSSNQQAAIAKALAGTRQQSRLIAMMGNYERVTELQQIAQRSAGATAAQAATYMQGMEAALNKVSVAWEKIVTASTKSDVVIGIIDGFGNFLDVVGTIFESTSAMIPIFVLIALKATEYIGLKLKEQEIARETARINTAIALQETKENIKKQTQLVQDMKNNRQAAKDKIQQHKNEQLNLLKENKIKAQGVLQDKNATGEQKKAAKETLANYDKEVQAVETKAKEETTAVDASIKLEGDKLRLLRDQEQLQSSQLSRVESLKTAWSGFAGIFSTVASKFRSLVQGVQQGIEIFKQAGTHEAASSAAVIPVVGWIIWATIEGIAVIAAVKSAIEGFMNWVSKWQKEEPSKQVNELSNEIYKLTERANAISQVEKQFDALDKKIIKTAEDQEKMNDLLNSATDKLSTDAEEGEQSDKDIYESLQSTQAKRAFLEEKELEYRNKANDARRQQLQIIRNLNEEQRKELLNAEDANSLMTQDAIFAINNNILYEYIDSLDQVNKGVESMTQSILEMLDAEQAWTYANDESGQSIKNLVNILNNASDLEENSLVEILNSDETSIKNRIEAYEQLRDVVANMGDPALFEAFTKAYQQWEDISEKLTDSAINFIDKIGLSIDGVNELGAAIQKLGYDADQSKDKLNELFSALESGTDLRTAITKVLGVEDGDYQKILNAYEKATGVTLLNIGQNIKSLQSQINSFYEKASKWGEMDETERTQFIQDNYKLFQGEDGEALYKAFEEGNYKAIQQALATNEALREQITLRLQDLKTRLQIAEAQEEINDAEVSYLKEQIALYEDYMDEESSVYQADLKLRLEKEQSQLDLYKEYLEKQQDALTDSLDKRKEAYEKYFDAIDRDEADEEYDAKANLLTANLSKLSSSTNATALQQTKELQQKFEDLEKERLQELRERAREAVLNNLDSEVSEINEKFDKLLEDQSALLAAMQGEISADPNGFANRMISSGIENMTATQAEDFIKNSFNSAFASELPSNALDNAQQGENLYLNINGQEIQIGESAQQDLYLTVMNALRQLGLK